MKRYIHRIPKPLLFPLTDEGEYYVCAENTELDVDFRDETLISIAARYDGNLYTVTTNGIEWSGEFADVLSDEVKNRLVNRFKITNGYVRLLFSNNLEALEHVLDTLTEQE